jgi:hypothetical protein
MSPKRKKKQRCDPNDHPKTIYADSVAWMIPSDSVPAWVGIDNYSTGIPTFDLVVPSTNRFVTFADIKMAMRERCVIFNVMSSDGCELIQFMLDEKDVDFHRRYPKAPVVGRKLYHG